MGPHDRAVVEVVPTSLKLKQERKEPSGFPIRVRRKQGLHE